MAVDLLAILIRLIVAAAGKSKTSETKLGDGLHVLQNLFAEGFGHLNGCVAGLGNVRRARSDNSLDGTLGEDVELVALCVTVENGHLLDIRVEGELKNHFPGGVVATDRAAAVPVEAGCEDHDGDFSGITTGVPVALISLVNVGEVSQGSNTEVLLESIFAKKSIVGGLGVHVLLSHVAWFSCAKVDAAFGRVERFIGLANGVCSSAGNPGLLRNHLTLCEGTSLVGANVGDTTKSFQRLQVANNHVTLNHALGAGSHSDGQDDHEGSRNHRKTGCDSVNDDILTVREFVGSKTDDSADDGDNKEKHR